MRIVVCLLVVLGCMGLAEETKNEARCSLGYYKCYYNSYCIPNYQVCDGETNCAVYGDDEMNCGTTSHTTEGSLCPEGQYECLTGLCIPDTWVCDGTEDCPDYGDDEDCFESDSITDTCPEDTYRCNYNGQCLLNSLVCDGVKDCPEYGDDEAGCTTHMPPHQQLECRDSFDYIYDRCVLVDPFTTTNWDEARYLCEKFSSDLVVLNDYNFYAELLQYIRDKGLDSYNYWVGATDRAAEGTWLWADSSPVPFGAPLWALYGCTGDYQLEPRPSDAASQDCALLDKDRGLHVTDASCDESFPTICQATSTKKETMVEEPIEKKSA
ncbi:sortilin-related receptor-like [Eriocheir sinensis]|uniref:sortilin-related receptor-like n=1 Tax=Eriocheir sinensis TaxID=95602 RepID=UPI0021C6B732|nr:sortilin-related receptor-like [Eriocheir sinensis]XP_050727587.1 sortilin-related receptor-like [Eriocheir sinensis]